MINPLAVAHDGILFRPIFVAHDGLVVLTGTAEGRGCACMRAPMAIADDALASTTTLGMLRCTAIGDVDKETTGEGAIETTTAASGLRKLEC